MTDYNDIGFTTGCKKLLDINDQEVQELIEKLNVDQLTELANAVTTGDKRKALMIYYASQDQKMSESVNSLNVGDLVYIGNKKGRVKIPNGPGDTVGVMIGKKMKMIDRENISLTEAGVMGMTMLPGLARMQELAGLCPSGTDDTGSVTAEVIEEPEDDHMACVMNALSALEGALPNVTLKDVKVIRGRLNDILRTMNESSVPVGRKLKD